MVQKARFIEFANSLKGAYEGFAEGLYLFAVSSGNEEKVLEYLEENLNATADEASKFLQELEGKKQSLNIIDDTELEPKDINWAIYRKDR